MRTPSSIFKLTLLGLFFGGVYYASRHVSLQAARAWIVDHYLESRVLGLTAEYYRRFLDAPVGTPLQDTEA